MVSERRISPNSGWLYITPNDSGNAPRIPIHLISSNKTFFNTIHCRVAATRMKLAACLLVFALSGFVGVQMAESKAKSSAAQTVASATPVFGMYKVRPFDRPTMYGILLAGILLQPTLNIVAQAALAPSPSSKYSLFSMPLAFPIPGRRYAFPWHIPYILTIRPYMHPAGACML